MLLENSNRHKIRGGDNVANGPMEAPVPSQWAREGCLPADTWTDHLDAVAFARTLKGPAVLEEAVK